ncbi:MAG: extracellular solute-binding protein, partial [Xanthomonadales bacterium]|nr:extracellular solute-binding protein [Xanthomonadales bacterium]
WFGLSVRARTLVYSTERVDPAELGGYPSLAGPGWRDRLCLRTSKKVYNQSLVAMLIAEHGEEATEAIVRGWVDNLAAPPFSNDTQLLEAIAAGQCDVGIANTYYFGRLQKDVADFPVRIFWPNQGGSGVHVNITGAGVTRHAKNPEGATQLLEWMASPAAQNLFADENMEYPVNPAVQADPLVAGWGDFEPNLINVRRAGELQADAVRLMDRAGYD